MVTLYLYFVYGSFYTKDGRSENIGPYTNLHRKKTN